MSEGVNMERYRYRVKHENCGKEEIVQVYNNETDDDERIKQFAAECHRMQTESHFYPCDVPGDDYTILEPRRW